MEFPNVPSKVISVVQGDPVVLKLALVTTELEFRAARRPKMDVSVAGQPEAARLAAAWRASPAPLRVTTGRL